MKASTVDGGKQSGNIPVDSDKRKQEPSEWQ